MLDSVTEYLPRYVTARGLRVLEAQGHTQLITAVSDRSYQLNSGAALIIACCEQPRTLVEIIGEIGDYFPGECEDALRSDVIDGVGQLVSMGLVEESYTRCNDWDAPVLITGSPRSGTSALARNLSTHDAFCIFNEFDLYDPVPEGTNAWRRIMSNDRNAPPRKVSTSATELKARLLRELPIPTRGLTTRNWLYGIARPKPRVYGDKMPTRYLRHMRDLSEQIPGIKFIITIRDGRAVVASQLRNYWNSKKSGKTPAPWAKPTIAEAESLWMGPMKLWLNLRDHLPAPCLEIRYEEAVLRPRHVLQEICAFTGVTYREQEFETFLKQYRPVNVHTWRDDHPDMERQLSHEFHELLREFGYEKV